MDGADDGRLAAGGIYFDEPILIIGAMVVGPEFGPIAAACVAIVQREPELARRSVRALLVGFPVGILATYFATLVPRRGEYRRGGRLRRLGHAGGAAIQLGINLGAIFLGGLVTIFIQRRLYAGQRRRHLMDRSRKTAGLPIGTSRREGSGHSRDLDPR